MAQQSYYYGTGRRKCAVARVRLVPGKGVVLVNEKPLEQVFPRLTLQEQVLRPLRVTQTQDKFDVRTKVEGGGICGQAGAIAHGIARALLKADESLKQVLRQYKLLTRDSRVKERKKYGLKRARKAPQYTKR